MDFLQTTEGILIVSVVSLALFCWVAFEIIKGGSKSQKIYVEAQKQTKLLIEIAKKNGVDEGIITEIIEEMQYYNQKTLY
jgi:SpoVK/Ycf46/Vps4 family AAA+-type ATPase